MTDQVWYDLLKYENYSEIPKCLINNKIIMKKKTTTKHPYVKGNFMWESDRRDGRVIWVQDEKRGKFKAVKLVKVKPKDPTKFICGCDPY